MCVIGQLFDFVFTSPRARRGCSTCVAATGKLGVQQ